MKIISIAFLLALPFSTSAFDLATKITQDGDTATLQTNGYAKVNLLKQAISLTGLVIVTGTLDLKGKGNVVMWSKVDGAYYFSKLPDLQNVTNAKGLKFKIPFNAASKTVTEVVIAVEMLGKGTASISGLSVGNG